MRNVSLILKQITRLLFIASFVVLSNVAYAQDPAKGEALYKSNNCGSCHKIDVRMTGPALGPTIASEPDEAYLVKWIQNNQALIAAKNPKALTIYNQFNQSQMSVFTNLSDQDVKDILGYVKAEWKKVEDAKKAAPAGATGAVADSGPSSTMVFGLIGVIVIAFLIILVLNRVIGTLERLLLQKQGLLPEDFEDDETSKPKIDRLATVRILAKNKKFVFFVVLCSVIGFGSWTWVTLWNTNVHQG
ncbi:MAG: cytochrome c, partial [Sphingobacteriaceae bacterium]